MHDYIIIIQQNPGSSLISLNTFWLHPQLGKLFFHLVGHGLNLRHIGAAGNHEIVANRSELLYPDRLDILAFFAV